VHELARRAICCKTDHTGALVALVRALDYPNSERQRRQTPHSAKSRISHNREVQTMGEPL
jgi:hypothetical protein